MKRILVVVGILAAAAAVAWLAAPALARVRPPIRVGILHSLTGPLAISEASMVDAEVLALEEINASGGLLGRRVEWVVADGRSDAPTFGREAARLIEQEKVSVIFGCCTSDCRKAVKPVVERLKHLLLYPVAYEGLEQSPNIIYCGAAPNQQIIPTVKWSRDVLKAKTYFLVGTDAVWSRSVNTIIKDQLRALGASVSGEEYLAADGGNLEAAVDKLIKARPDVVLSTIEGDANLPFFKKMRSNGGEAVKIPVISFPLSEDELRQLPTRDMVNNDYLVCNYFQSIDRPENYEFVKKFKARFGAERVTGDAIDTAHNAVKFWAQAANEAESADPEIVTPALLRQSLDAPEGVISIDRETQHTWRPLYVGRVRGDGQVEVLYTLDKPIRPVPFPFSRTRAGWESYLESLYSGWDHNWSPPAARRGSASGRS